MSLEPVDSSRSADPVSLTEAIRRAVVDAGEAAFEDAGIQGLCAEGRWEAAVAAMRAVDVGRIAGTAHPAPRPSATD